MFDKPRDNERAQLPLEVRWHGLSGKHAARTSDISMGGCYIESLAQVSVGERILFEIQLPSGRWIPLSGNVVHHHTGMGFGVRFSLLSDMVRDMLAEIIAGARDR
ncbi:MAG TPA: PilZ domain-containing protein [Pyrinomonadaceae bacterium]|nr:PilZ domain-containing protein [Pyrinomonadaceae bacterium]